MFCLKSLALITHRSTMKFLAMRPIIFPTLHLWWDHTPRYQDKFKDIVFLPTTYIYIDHIAESLIYKAFAGLKKKKRITIKGKKKRLFWLASGINSQQDAPRALGRNHHSFLSPVESVRVDTLRSCESWGWALMTTGLNIILNDNANQWVSIVWKCWVEKDAWGYV